MVLVQGLMIREMDYSRESVASCKAIHDFTQRQGCLMPIQTKVEVASLSLVNISIR